MRRVRAGAGAETVHEWRKRVKDLWYQLRLVRKAWPDQLDPLAEDAHALADQLGDHHDLTVLAADLAGREELAESGVLAALIERRQSELLDAALKLGARLYAEKPKAFERRLGSYWAAWRG
jgi:CHAD domain-containing protein